MHEDWTVTEPAATTNSDTLDRAEWAALLDLSGSRNHFEPIAARRRTGDLMADRLVRMGLAETGPCSPPFAARGYRTGYRLTQLGWYVLDRPAAATLQTDQSVRQTARRHHGSQRQPARCQAGGAAAAACDAVAWTTS
jgi:hypothetical protein